MSSVMLVIETRGQGWKRSPDNRNRIRNRSRHWVYTNDALSRAARDCAKGLAHNPKCRKLSRLLAQGA